MTLSTAIQTYWQNLVIASNETGELTHRAKLEILLNNAVAEFRLPHTVVHEPKRGRFGAPDFRIDTTAEGIIGYLENKKLSETDLDKILATDQLKKYRSLSENLVLTNYHEFVWLREGTVERRVRLGAFTDLTNPAYRPSDASVADLTELLRLFLQQEPPALNNAKQLAGALAKRAKSLHDILLAELDRQQTERRPDTLLGLYDTFRTNVSTELTLSEFSDAFAQMLAYGLFLAKLNADAQPITLLNARTFIPHSFELVRELVGFLDHLEKPQYQEARWLIRELLAIFNRLDLDTLRSTLSFRTQALKKSLGFDEPDPYLYFYEDFLAAYDRDLRKQKGVYYTPPAVVGFIVRAIDSLLREKFGIAKGLADRHRVTALDFATGTGTFLFEILKLVLGRVNSATRPDYVREHILKNLYGFEYLIAPYTIAHLKLSQYLKEEGYTLADDERFQIFLTNTLEPLVPQTNAFVPHLSAEGKEAQRIKEKPVLVVTGNPPYSGISKNNGKWITNLIETYKYVDGKHFGERKHWLQDDYVKFIRFAQHKMSQVAEGVVGIITNHSFLDNPTFRGMRQSLMESFDELYFLNLHGNVKKKEKAPGGGKDENVFDIEQGVAISLLVKYKKALVPFMANQAMKGTSAFGQVYYADLFGTRTHKYNFSIISELGDVNWKQLSPTSPHYLFKDSTASSRNDYTDFYSIADIFQLQVTGVVTARDSFAIAIEYSVLENRINFFKDSKYSDANIAKELNLKDTRGWKIPEARKEMSSLPDVKEYIHRVAYRPFDDRYIFYHKSAVDWGRWGLLNHMFQPNIALVTSRQASVIGEDIFDAVSVTDSIGDFNYFRRGGINVFPLYRYEAETGLFAGGMSKVENLTKAFREFVDAHYGRRYTPEQILGYCYAVLHSPTYRSKYAEFLKIDFPRIPFAEAAETFEAVSTLGWKLAQAHLLKQNPPAVGTPCRYHGTGTHTVVKVTWAAPRPELGETGGRLCINADQYFAPVPEDVWTFHIGGYQVLAKYLKDRKGRTLRLDEIEHLEAVVAALAFTVQQMARIDEATREWV
jgi:hypothetical protein